MEDVSGDTAECQTSEARPAVGTDDDDIGSCGTCCGDDFGGRVALAPDGLRLKTGAAQLSNHGGSQRVTVVASGICSLLGQCRGLR